MIYLVMGSRGFTFDGLDSTAINTNVPTTSENFKATGSTNQFQTVNSSSMTFTTVGTSPSYRFTNNQASSSTSTLEAGNLTLAGTINSTGTITSGSTITGSGFTTSGDITSKTISSNIASGTGTTANFQNNSASATLQVLNNSGSISNKVVANLFTPNVPSGNNSQIWYGKNQSSNSNSFALQYNYTADASNNNSLSIRAFGDTNGTLEIYPTAKTPTSPDSSNVYIRGDLGAGNARVTALALHSSLSSQFALNLLAGPSTSNYTLRFPSNIGTTNDYLQLANSGTGQLQWSSGTGGGGSSAYIATLYRTGATQTIALNSNATVQYATGVYDVNTNLEYNTAGATYPYYFKNISGTTIYVQVIANSTFTQTASSFNTLDIRFASSTSVAPASATTQAQGRLISTQTSGTTSLVATAIIKLGANECFLVQAANTSANTVDISNNRIYAQVLGGSGVQSITLNPQSSIFSSNGQQSGFNPTVNLGLASTPSGSGTTLVLQSSPTINTPTLTSPTISGTITYTGTLTPSTVTTPGLYETSLEIDYSTASLTLTSANTKVFIFGTTGSSFTLTLPSTSTINEGDIIKIINGTTSKTITINNSSATQIDSLRPTQVAFYVCLSTSTQSWRDLGLFDRDKMEQTSNSLLLKSGVDLQLTGSSSSLVTTIQAAPSTTAFNFILPTSTGTIGQFLTSGGSGQPLTWSNALPSNQPLAIDVSASYIGNSSTSSSPSLPSLIVDGLPTSSTAPILQVRSFRTGTNTVPLHVLSPSMPTNSYTAIRIGLSEATLNSVRLNYNYSSSGSLSNTLSIALSAQPETVIFRSPNSSSPQIDVTGSIQASGDLTINNISCAQITSSATSNVMGDVSLISTSSVLRAQSTNNSGNATFQVYNWSSTNTNMLLSEFTAANILSGSTLFARYGKSNSENGRVGYNYNGDGNITNNLFFGLQTAGFSYAPTMKIFTQGTTSTNGSTGSVIITGGLGANSLGCDALNVEGRTYQSGVLSQTDLTLWWAYDSVDATATVSYSGLLPPEISPTVNNRRYSFQQIGKQYSFALNFCASISQVSKQLHVVFIRLTNHTLPTPYTGYCEISEKTTSPGYSMNLDTPFGCHIPAQ